jgi:hypothetical protein
MVSLWLSYVIDTIILIEWHNVGGDCCFFQIFMLRTMVLTGNTLLVTVMIIVALILNEVVQDLSKITKNY